jgi:hypothetical protein
VFESREGVLFYYSQAKILQLNDALVVDEIVASVRKREGMDLIPNKYFISLINRKLGFFFPSFSNYSMYKFFCV